MIGKILFFVMFWCSRYLLPHVVVLTDGGGDDAIVKGIVMTVNPIVETEAHEDKEVTLVISVE